MIPAPLHTRPVRDHEIPFINACYDYTATDASDTTMVWGSQVDTTPLFDFLGRINARSSVIVGSAAILARTVALALGRHECANSRLVGSRVYGFNERNIVMPIQTPCGAALTLLRKVDQMSYEQIAIRLLDDLVHGRDVDSDLNRTAWFTKRLPVSLRRPTVRWLLWAANHFRLPITPPSQHLTAAPVLVNHFAFPKAPPLLSYKPSRFGSRAMLINVTLGPAHSQPIVVGEGVEIRPMAGLFVRADHRTMEARQLAEFVGSIIEILSDPGRHDIPQDEK